MLSRDVARQLAEIVGEDRCLEDREDIVSCSYDSYIAESMPDAVIYPETAEEVSRILKAASRVKIPVTPRCAGTSFSGGAVPAGMAWRSGSPG